VITPFLQLLELLTAGLGPNELCPLQLSTTGLVIGEHFTPEPLAIGLVVRALLTGDALPGDPWATYGTISPAALSIPVLRDGFPVNVADENADINESSTASSGALEVVVARALPGDPWATCGTIGPAALSIPVLRDGFPAEIADENADISESSTTSSGAFEVAAARAPSNSRVLHSDSEIASLLSVPCVSESPAVVGRDVILARHELGVLRTLLRT